MYFLLTMGIFQPAMLVYRRVGILMNHYKDPIDPTTKASAAEAAEGEAAVEAAEAKRKIQFGA